MNFKRKTYKNKEDKKQTNMIIIREATEINGKNFLISLTFKKKNVHDS